MLCNHCCHLVAASLLSLPDGIPPPLMTLHVCNPLWSTWVWDLWTMIVSNTAMRVIDLRSNVLNDLGEIRIITVGLRHIDPMRQVCTQLELRKPWDDISCIPRAVEISFAMRFVAHKVPF